MRHTTYSYFALIEKVTSPLLYQTVEATFANNGMELSLIKFAPIPYPV